MPSLPFYLCLYNLAISCSINYIKFDVGLKIVLLRLSDKMYRDNINLVKRYDLGTR